MDTNFKSIYVEIPEYVDVDLRKQKVVLRQIT